MGMLDLLFRNRARRGAADRPVSPPTTTSTTTQKDLLRVVLREALFRNGIPSAWVSPDVLRAVHAASRHTGLHLRLVLRHWDPRLMEHAVALEKDIFARLQLLDPNAAEWFLGFSWQFGLADISACPQLPHPGTWTAPPPPFTRKKSAGVPQAQGDVISGPVTIKAAGSDARADLERLLAGRDEDMRRLGGDTFAHTQPVSL